MIIHVCRFVFAAALISTCAFVGNLVVKAEEPAKKAVSMFDGKTLEGWEGNEKMFRVEDGAIVCGTLKEKIKVNYFLASKKEYKNFELKLKFRFATDDTNSGVMFWSKRLPKSEAMSGYQADLGNGYWGSLYDESRRDKVMDHMDQKQAIKLVKKGEGEWNDYRVLAEGKHIQIWLNGTQTIDYTEKGKDKEGNEIPQAGLFGLQIHAGGPSEAWFKDISITELP